MYARALLVLGLLSGAAGCAYKSGAAPATQASYGYGGGGYDDYDEGLAEMDAPASISADYEMEPERFDRASRRRERRAAKRSDNVAGSAAPGDAATPMEPARASAEASDGAGEAEPAVADDGAQDHARHIIYTASMQVSVFNLEDAKTRAESLPEKYGGFIQNMSANYFVMRIPAVKLRPAMDELAGLGVVDNRTLDAQDVTEEYLDIETRIEVLQATQKQMMELLTKARTVEEALKVRQALDQITMELEVLKGRLRRMSNLVSFSTLTLSLVERGPHTPTPSSNDPFPWVDELGVEATEWK